MKGRTLVCLSWLSAILLTALLTSACEAGHRHRYEESVVAPTCAEAGYTLYHCACGDECRDETAPALGHRYGATVVDPTYLTAGYTRYRCDRCGDAYDGEPTPPLTGAVSPLATPSYLEPREELSRPRKHLPEMVMLHFTSAVVLTPEDPYDGERVRQIFLDYGVSVHYIVDREGGVTCYVPEELVAYHAGTGTWDGVEAYTNAMNEYAIGIEIMAIGSVSDMASYLTPAEYGRLAKDDIGFTDAQYRTLAALVQDICARNGIPFDREHIIGHEEYSPGKSDPGELFDWGRLFP